MTESASKKIAETLNKDRLSSDTSLPTKIEEERSFSVSFASPGPGVLIFNLMYTYNCKQKFPF
jgi:hypothetical protein